MDELTVRVWVRGWWRLPDGHSMTRTAKRAVHADRDDEDDEDHRRQDDHADDAHERRLVVLHEFMEELRATGQDFAEGHGSLIEILGTMTD